MNITELWKLVDKYIKLPLLNAKITTKKVTLKEIHQRKNLSTLLDRLEFYLVDFQFVEHLGIPKQNLSSEGEIQT